MGHLWWDATQSVAHMWVLKGLCLARNTVASGDECCFCRWTSFFHTSVCLTLLEFWTSLCGRYSPLGENWIYYGLSGDDKRIWYPVSVDVCGETNRGMRTFGQGVTKIMCSLIYIQICQPLRELSTLYKLVKWDDIGRPRWWVWPFWLR